MTNEEQQKREREAALYGPAGQADYEAGDIVKFLDPHNRQSQELQQGKLIFVRAPGEGVRGGIVHPTSFYVLPRFGGFPIVIYASDIVELVSRAADKQHNQDQ